MANPRMLARRPVRSGAWLRLRVIAVASGCVAEDEEKQMVPAGVSLSDVDETGSVDSLEDMMIANGREVCELSAAFCLATRLEERVLGARRARAVSDAGDKPGLRCLDD
ncbi:hypothetical protein TKK_0016248 [Trichogramma kaykai]